MKSCNYICSVEPFFYQECLHVRSFDSFILVCFQVEENSFNNFVQANSVGLILRDSASIGIVVVVVIVAQVRSDAHAHATLIIVVVVVIVAEVFEFVGLHEFGWLLVQGFLHKLEHAVAQQVYQTGDQSDAQGVNHEFEFLVLLVFESNEVAYDADLLALLDGEVDVDLIHVRSLEGGRFATLELVHDFNRACAVAEFGYHSSIVFVDDVGDLAKKFHVGHFGVVERHVIGTQHFYVLTQVGDWG